MKKLGWIMACLYFVASLVSSASAEEITGVNLKIEHVALFKNGLGYFTSTATLPGKSTSVNFGQIPIPSLGTFWVGYSKNVAVKGLFTEMDEAMENVPAYNVGQILAANIGRKATITIGDQTVTGDIAAVTQIPSAEPASPYFMSARRPDSSRNYAPNPPTAQVVVLKTDAGVVTLNAGSIIRADIEGADVKTSIPVAVKKPRIVMEFQKPATGEKVSVSYLARGITWSPSYLVDLSDSKTARFTAKALIINEVADLRDVGLNLVTGFPNIQFSDINSPVAMSQSLSDFLNALQRGRSEQRDSSMTQQRAISSNLAGWDGDARAPMPNYSTAAAGTVSEDLFLYPTERFTLKKGETCYLPLFTAEVPYEHIYVWKIPDFLDRSERYQNGQDRNTPEPAEEVWHSCRLTNNMKMPWTTAPAEFVKDGSFTGQDVCYYTAPGAQTTIRINRAMNVLAEQGEYEIERKRDAAHFYGYGYDLVKVKGELKLRSRLDKSANVEVTKELSGEVREIVPATKDISTARGLEAGKPGAQVRVDFELKSGEEQTLTYTYEVYVRE